MDICAGMSAAMNSPHTSQQQGAVGADGGIGESRPADDRLVGSTRWEALVATEAQIR